MSAACVHDVPSNTSVWGTICLSSCPPTTTSLSPTTAAAGAARACCRLASSTHLPSRSANTLSEAWVMVSVAPPITTTSPR